jgi:hypothetical protein
MTRTYSLAEVAEVYLPPEWTDSVRWLSRRLNRGEIRGYRVGRVWRMRDSDIDYMLTKYGNETTAAPQPASENVTPEPMCIADGLSQRSRRRLMSAS